MSGIVGFFNFKEKIMNSQEILMNMNNKLMHRGSDKDGYYIGDNIALGFRTILCGDNQPISFNFEGNGFRYLLQELMIMIRDKRTECTRLFYDESVKIIEILETINQKG